MSASGDNNDQSHATSSLQSQGSGLFVPPTTPLRRSSADSIKRSSHHSTPVSQKELQGTLRTELLEATFESDQLSDTEPLSSGVMDEIKEHLPEWPPEGGEAAYYKPVLDTIKTVRDILKKHRTAGKAVYDDHGLCVYDREMLDGVERAHPVKPDLILTQHKKLKSKERVRWRDVDVAIEVKSEWRDLVLQAATYARALFYSNWTRTFALVIGINHRSRTARFMFFHRAGLTSTRELTMDGQKPMFSEFVRMLDTIFSWNEPEMAGFFSTASRDCAFGGITILSGRTCIRGRANRVAVLSREEKSSPIPPAAPPQTQDGMNLRRSARNKKSAREVRPPSGSNVQVPPSRSASGTRPPPTGEASPAADAIPTDITSPAGNARTNTGKNSSVGDARPGDMEALADACAVYRLGGLEFTNKDHSAIPPKLAFKDSWPAGGSVELDTYSTISGQFGLPVLWGFQKLGDNRRFVDGATFWNVFGIVLGAELPKCEMRTHVRLYYSTVGQPLDNCQTPYKLFECILHAMIGHYNMLMKSKALHRDVSEGNILIVEEDVTDASVFNELFGSDEHRPAKCRGILIDGDLAKHISTQKESSPGKSISGTLPYMSINLLSRWTEDNLIYHNPNDDLESGVWVAVICGLEQSVKYNASKREKAWLADLLAHEPRVISNAKRAIRESEAELSLDPEKIHAFYGLIVDWLQLLKVRAVLDNFGAEGPITKERYIASYEEFLREGFAWLEARKAELRRHWGEFFSLQKQNLPRHW